MQGKCFSRKSQAWRCVSSSRMCNRTRLPFVFFLGTQYRECGGGLAEKSWPPTTSSFKDQARYVFAFCLLPREFSFRFVWNKSEKMRTNIQIMYFNVFFAVMYIRNAVCRTRRDTWKVSSKEASRSVPSPFFHFPLALPLPAYPTIFIIKVNDIFCCPVLLPRGDDTHTWLKIDVVFFCRTKGHRKYFSSTFLSSRIFSPTKFPCRDAKSVDYLCASQEGFCL